MKRLAVNSGRDLCHRYLNWGHFPSGLMFSNDVETIFKFIFLFYIFYKIKFNRIHLIDFYMEVGWENTLLPFKSVYFNSEIEFRKAENINIVLRSFRISDGSTKHLAWSVWGWIFKLIPDILYYGLKWDLCVLVYRDAGGISSWKFRHALCICVHMEHHPTYAWWWP